MKKNDRSPFTIAKMLPWTIPVLLVVVALVSIFYKQRSSVGWDILIPDSSSNVHAITFDASGRAWVGANDVINVYDGETQITHDPGLDFGRAKVIAFDPAGNPWVGGGGLYVFDGETWKTYTIDNSKLVHNSVGSIAFDQEGKAWIGSMGGLTIIDGETWTTRTKDSSGNDYEGEEILEITIDPSGRVWIGSKYGIDIFDGENWTTYNTDNSELMQDTVLAITFDAEGKAWIGAGGINVFDGNTWTNYTSSNSDLLSNHVSNITFDPAGRAWIGSWYGISVFDGETWTTFTKDNSGLPGNRIFEIAIDPSGRAWIGLKCLENCYGNKLVLAPTGENLTNSNIIPESFVNFQYLFIVGNSIWLTLIGLSLLFSAFTLKIHRAYIGVLGWLGFLLFAIERGAIFSKAYQLPIVVFGVRYFYLITTLGAIGSILAGILARSSEKREQMISLGFRLGIGLGIGISVLFTLIITFVPQ